VEPFHDYYEWMRTLRFEYPSVEFERVETQPRGVNAVCEGVLVGRFYEERTLPYGVIFEQPRSCGGRA
jgi:hypothetical protein